MGNEPTECINTILSNSGSDIPGEITNFINAHIQRVTAELRASVSRKSALMKAYKSERDEVQADRNALALRCEELRKCISRHEQDNLALMAELDEAKAALALRCEGLEKVLPTDKELCELSIMWNRHAFNPTNVNERLKTMIELRRGIDQAALADREREK